MQPQLHDDYLSLKILKKPNVSMSEAWLKPELARYGPPLRTIPESLLGAFTMNGEIEVSYPNLGSLEADSYAATETVWSEAMVDEYRAKVRQHVGAFQYPVGDIYDFVSAFRDKLQGQRGLVIGSWRPWLEAILLENGGVSHLHTLDWLIIKSEHPQISAQYAPAFTRDFLDGKIAPFDFVISFSSLEHDGLTRYGDPINPNGDLQSVAKVFSYVKPGGFFYLGLPVDTIDKIDFPWHRIYGPKRLVQILAGWNLVAVFPERMPNTHSFSAQPLFVLQNPYGCANGKSYDEILSEPLLRAFGLKEERN